MENVEMVSLAAYESQNTSFRRIIKWLIMGWAISMVAMGLVLVISLSYTEEVVTETTETTAEVIQDASDNGSNVYAGGDVNGGYADSTPNGNEDDDNTDNEEGSSLTD